RELARGLDDLRRARGGRDVVEVPGRGSQRTDLDANHRLVEVVVGAVERVVDQNLQAGAGNTHRLRLGLARGRLPGGVEVRGRVLRRSDLHTGHSQQVRDLADQAVDEAGDLGRQVGAQQGAGQQAVRADHQVEPDR